MLVYDTLRYSNTLSHLGKGLTLKNTEIPIIKRPISVGSNLHDAMGVWPYSSAPKIDSAMHLREQMVLENLVTYSAILRPDCVPNIELFKKIGFDLRVLKDHFVCDPKLPFPSYSPKTRFNIRRGMRLWDVHFISLEKYSNEVSVMHEALATARSFSKIVHLHPSHFSELALIGNVQVLGAFDEDGLGAALITIHHLDEVHFHVITGAERAYKNNAFYSLYNKALELWGKTKTIYMGGVPSGLNAMGIERFKQRFSNRKTPVFMIYTTLNQGIYQSLLDTHPNKETNWFPGYRAP